VRERVGGGVREGEYDADGLGEDVCDWLGVFVTDGLPDNVSTVSIRSSTGGMVHTFPRRVLAIAEEMNNTIVSSFICIYSNDLCETFFRFQYKCPRLLLMRLLSLD
jgi:hypothetical protein